LSPNASPAEKDNLLKGWFNELLPDLNQNEPEVALRNSKRSLVDRNDRHRRHPAGHDSIYAARIYRDWSARF
jgi:hypothetical protein